MSASDKRLTPSRTVTSESQDDGQQEWDQFWPGTEATTEAATEAIVEEVITDFEQRSVQDYLEGHRSESQGQ